MSGLTAVICVSLGLVMAYALNRTKIPLKALVSLALILPLLAPSLLSAWADLHVRPQRAGAYLTGIEMQITACPGW